MTEKRLTLGELKHQIRESIKYPLSELIKVEALVASKLIPHTFDNFKVKINANIDRRILP